MFQETPSNRSEYVSVDKRLTKRLVIPERTNTKLRAGNSQRQGLVILRQEVQGDFCFNVFDKGAGNPVGTWLIRVGFDLRRNQGVDCLYGGRFSIETFQVVLSGLWTYVR